MAAATTKQKQLTPVQRAAAVVIALGADRASEVYRYLKDDEVEQISLEIAKLNRLSPEDMQSTIEDFYGLCVTQKVITEGGVLYAKDVLEKALPAPEQASSYMDRLSKSLRTRSFESHPQGGLQEPLDDPPGWSIPQTIALVLSYARSDQAAQIIAELPRAVQLDVVERIAGLDRVSPEMIKLVEDYPGSPLHRYHLCRSGGSGRCTVCGRDHEPCGPFHREIHLRRTGRTQCRSRRRDPQAHVHLRGHCRSGQHGYPAVYPGSGYQRIWLWPSRAPTKKSSVLFSRTCPPVCGRISSRISSSCTTCGMRQMWKRPSGKSVGVIRQLEEAGEIVIAKGEEDEILALR